jgi:hypothetical protein
VLDDFKLKIGEYDKDGLNDVIRQRGEFLAKAKEIAESLLDRTPMAVLENRTKHMSLGAFCVIAGTAFQAAAIFLEAPQAH